MPRSSSSQKRARSKRNKIMKAKRAVCKSSGLVFDAKSKKCREPKARARMSRSKALARRRSSARKARNVKRAISSVLTF